MSEILKTALRQLIGGQDLTRDETRAALAEIMAGAATDAQVAGFLTALRMKRETVDEITGAVEAMRAHVLPIALDADVILDCCGTGGDGAGTFNISTAVSFVCAAAGITVAKHGNRAISSRVGSADVLEALGVRIDLGADAVKRCIDEIGIGFMFAPTHHAALRHASNARRQLGFRTMLNLLGPMTNPASATHQLVGIFDPERLETVARVLGRLGARRALVVHGCDGLDEVTLAGPTRAVLWDQGTTRALTLTPGEFGFDEAPASAVAGGDATTNAATVRRVLEGAPGPARDIVQLNAGCALWAAEQVASPADGVRRAGALLESGAGLAKLAALAAKTQALGGP